MKVANSRYKDIEKENASILKKQLEITEEKDFLFTELKTVGQLFFNLELFLNCSSLFVFMIFLLISFFSYRFLFLLQIYVHHSFLLQIRKKRPTKKLSSNSKFCENSCNKHLIERKPCDQRF